MAKSFLSVRRMRKVRYASLKGLKDETRLEFKFTAEGRDEHSARDLRSWRRPAGGAVRNWTGAVREHARKNVSEIERMELSKQLHPAFSLHWIRT